MGGCRCSYRSCKATSDRHTHFFHYPVFDKLRCHQWIANGRRFDLLNLKLAQLKNRVVCQHHFRDEMFMNIRKQKLTRNAIPTEDGPFQAKKSEPPDPLVINSDNQSTLQEVAKVEEINGDDTKYFTMREKVATFSVPYKQFLKNSDLDTLNDPDLLKSLPSTKKKDHLPTSRIFMSNTEVQTSSDRSEHNNARNHKEQSRKKKRTKNSNLDTLNDQELLKPLLSPKKKIHHPSGDIKEVNTSSVQSEDNNARNHMEQSKIAKSNKCSNRKENVVILSEEKITDPLQIKPKVLKKISPSCILEIPRKPVAQVKEDIDTSSVNTQLPADVVTEFSDNLQYAPPPKRASRKNSSAIPNIVKPVMPLHPPTAHPVANDSLNEMLPHLVSVESMPVDNLYVVHPAVLPVEFISEKAEVPVAAPATTPKPTRLTPTLSPEKIADIDRKRKYNMKLRDVVEQALVHLDEAKQTRTRSPSPIHKSKHICSRPKKVHSLSAALLSKVRENSRDIAEIKDILLQQTSRSANLDRKSVKDKCVGGDWNEDSRKKYLFEEISQYLSSKLKSDLYEELFLNFAKPKRRATRRT